MNDTSVIAFYYKKLPALFLERFVLGRIVKKSGLLLTHSSVEFQSLNHGTSMDWPRSNYRGDSHALIRVWT